MIPKTIHYCWFGGEETQLVQDCVRSWQESLAGYRIVRWSQENFDVNQNELARQWYRRKLYSFVADFARTKILHDQGGIYLDSDTFVLPGRNFDALLDNRAFIGFQYPWPAIHGPDNLENNRIGTGVMGAEPRHPFIARMLEMFSDPSLRNVFDVTHPDFVLPVDHAKAILMAQGLTAYGMQVVDGVRLLPKEYFLQGLVSPSRTPPEATASSICVHLGALAWKPLLDEYRQSAGRRAAKRVLRALGLFDKAKRARDRVLKVPAERRGRT